MKIDEIKRDLQSFADDESDVINYSDGTFMITKQGKDISFKVIQDVDTGGISISYNGTKMTYRAFIANHIAHLDIFAQKLAEKRAAPKYFVNSSAFLKSVGEEKTGNSLELLEENCSHKIFATKITFITADAGHGKTALLKEFQFRQAEKYLRKESNYIFWHVDLQGRSLVRLNEALMYDLGELRISGLGLYHASILTLIRIGLLVLAIDGFDELAAEIGGAAALGSLSYLVNQLDDKGTIIAASRRTFFSTQDYLRRNSLLKSSVSPKCEFQEIKLEPWTKTDAIAYIQALFPNKNPESIYEGILYEAQGNTQHPILTRPFLLTKTLDLLGDDDGLKTSTIIKPFEKENSLEGVAAVVEAFTKREVTKWKLRDTETGIPYLTYEQHLLLLELIADQMWQSQMDNISTESIEFYTTELCLEWQIDESASRRVVSMASAHALLVPVDGENNLRKFEHEEFKNYFIARNLAHIFNKISSSKSEKENLKRFLQFSQLPDSVAQYACAYIKSASQKSVSEYLDILADMVNNEWKPTFLQVNIGTLVPFLVDEIYFPEKLLFDAKINFSSLCFENKKIERFIFSNANFINISFKNTYLNQTEFKKCNFNELRIYRDSENNFTEVSFENCSISALSIYDNTEYTIYSVYNPERIQSELISLGFSIFDEKARQIENIIFKEPSEFKKALLKFLNLYQRGTVQFESNILNDNTTYKQYKKILLEDVIPFLEKHQVIRETEKTKSTRQVLHRAWSLNVNLEDLLKGDGEMKDDNYYSFWQSVDNQ
jgi:uncharacterized protein YjbI with pentapeptide repeats